MSEKNTAPEGDAKSVNALEAPTFFGQKAGMTRIFDENGNHVPVTVVKLIPNYISQVKTNEKEGYSAYQIAYYEKRDKLVNAPLRGHLKKAKIPKKLARYAEIRMDKVDPSLVGQELSLSHFTASTYVDISGETKGKGFQGVIKRYNFQGGPAAHGSKFHRTTGSIGNRATPGKVFKQKKMPGHMGCKNRTMQNLRVVEINEEKGYILIRGSIPGSKNGFVRISKARKK